MIEAEWDERYAQSDRIWSGQPNQALVAEVGALTPGRVLDVGCGEGADAVWLARCGWTVTALDVSGVALDRARAHARDAGVEISWVHAGLVEAELPRAAYDLVSAQYPALPRTGDDDAVRALLAAVAPGGTLVIVHHLVDHDTAHQHGFDPNEYVMPADVMALLAPLVAAGRWTVEVDEQRPRHVVGGAGAGHSVDVILRARRLD